jgi:3-oxoacyl-[acyl-carrier-protein] synthase-3
MENHMKVSIDNIAITGIATALPANTLDLATLASLYGDNEVRLIMSGTGIKSVRVAPEGMQASDLCMAAASNLLKNLDIDPATIDGIVFVSQTPDLVMPATSAMMQHRLGISTNAVAFDINYGCSGYIYGLYQAAMLIAKGGCSRVLLCAGDVITPLLHPDDHNVRMILGDAGSATLIESGDYDLDFALKTDGSGMQHLRLDRLNHLTSAGDNKSRSDLSRVGYLHMNGSEIMTFALREVPLIIEELLSMKGWCSDEVGSYALHQANHFMLNYLRKKMRLSIDSVPIAVENTGNTGPASIPLLLSLTHNQLREEGRLEKVVMCGFGVGLSWGATALNLSNAKIFAPVEI